MGRGGEKAEKGRGRGRKNKPKKQNLFARKRNQEKRKTFLQPNFVPLPGKSHAPKKRLVWGGWLSGLRPVLRHIDLAGKDLACRCVG